jgi:hypothetical protein
MRLLVGIVGQQELSTARHFLGDSPYGITSSPWSRRDAYHQYIVSSPGHRAPFSGIVAMPITSISYHLPVTELLSLVSLRCVSGSELWSFPELKSRDSTRASTRASTPSETLVLLQIHS